MQYVLIIVFSEDLTQVLLQYKEKGPYPSSWNCPGGKIDEYDDSSEAAAHRELEEETDVTGADLHYVTYMEFPSGACLTIYACKVKMDEVRQVELEPLAWYDTEQILVMDVTSTYLAGEGNVPYLINLARNILRGESPCCS